MQIYSNIYIKPRLGIKRITSKQYFGFKIYHQLHKIYSICISSIFTTCLPLEKLILYFLFSSATHSNPTSTNRVTKNFFISLIHSNCGSCLLSFSYIIETSRWKILSKGLKKYENCAEYNFPIFNANKICRINNNIIKHTTIS